MGNAAPWAGWRAVLSLAASAAVAGVAPGCRGRDAEHSQAEAPSPTGKAAEAPAAAAADTPVVAKVAIPWLSDDYPAALARAKAEKKPLFIDMWAPWCHTCLSMKQVVMVDPSLAPFLDRFVWLEVDTDRPVNAPLLSKLDVHTWPTFYVLSPGEEAVQARHLGAASISQLRELLEQGEAGHQDAMAAAGALPAGSPLAHVRAGDRYAAGGDLVAADRAYGEALAAAPRDWARIPDVLVKQIAARARGEDYTGCADLGMREMERAAAGGTASATDFASYADGCADVLEKTRARSLRQHLSESLGKVVDAPGSAMSIDDRSDGLLRLREMADGMGDTKAARALAARQRDLLDAAVGAAPNAYGRMTFVWPRSEVYVYLGEGEKLIPELEKLAADLPEEYDPPYRLAWVALQVGQLEKALPAAERAVGMVYGPRKGRALALVADIHKARGDVAAERTARKAVVDYYASLPAGHKSPQAAAAAQEALAAVGKPGADKTN